jgi:putative transposase
MKKSRYTEEQIIGILKQHEAGVKTADVCREHGISAATFYGWKSKYGGMEVSEAQRLKAIEDENRRLKLLVAELSLHGEALKAVIRKNGLREEVAFISVEFRLSNARLASCWAWSGRAIDMSIARTATSSCAKHW